MRKSGGILSSWALSEEYGFSDVDGNRPHWGRYFAANFPQFTTTPPATGRRWELVEVGKGTEAQAEARTESAESSPEGVRPETVSV